MYIRVYMYMYIYIYMSNICIYIYIYIFGGSAAGRTGRGEQHVVISIAGIIIIVIIAIIIIIIIIISSSSIMYCVIPIRGNEHVQYWYYLFMTYYSIPIVLWELATYSGLLIHR